MQKKRNFKWVKQGNEFVQVPVNIIEKAMVSVASKELIRKRDFTPHLKGTSGVYVIICEKEKSVYVGQSVNVPVRLRNHKMCLINNSNDKLYLRMLPDFIKHGIDAFEFRLYKPCVGALSELLADESFAMYAFAEKGYRLYNVSMSQDLRDLLNEDKLICPKKYHPIMKKILNRLLADELFIDKIEAALKITVK